MKTTTAKPTYAFHFTGNKLRDGRPVPPVGEWLEHCGPVIICRRGLHASHHPFDALRYAPGSSLHLVEMDGVAETPAHTEKIVASRRRIIASLDATGLLRDFARACALSVIDKWAAPPGVREYLETGNPALQEEVLQVTSEDDEKALEWLAVDEVGACGCAARVAARAATRMVELEAAKGASWSASLVANVEFNLRSLFLEMVMDGFKQSADEHIRSILASLEFPKTP